MTLLTLTGCLFFFFFCVLPQTYYLFRSVNINVNTWLYYSYVHFFVFTHSTHIHTSKKTRRGTRPSPLSSSSPMRRSSILSINTWRLVWKKKKSNMVCHFTGFSSFDTWRHDEPSKLWMAAWGGDAGSEEQHSMLQWYCNVLWFPIRVVAHRPSNFMVNNYEGDVAWNIEGGKAGCGGVVVQYTQHSFATRVPTFEPYVGVDAETQQHLETRKMRTRLKSRKRGILLHSKKFNALVHPFPRKICSNFSHSTHFCFVGRWGALLPLWILIKDGGAPTTTPFLSSAWRVRRNRPLAMKEKIKTRIKNKDRLKYIIGYKVAEVGCVGTATS